MTIYGPFNVVGASVRTGVMVRSGDHVRVTSSGTVNFGGGIGPWNWFAPVLTADGDPFRAPDDYPSPGHRKNSLLCQIGAVSFQGGQNASFTSSADGELILAVNDRYWADNTMGWSVTVEHTPIARPPGSRMPALSLGWLEAVQVTQNRSGTVPLIDGKRTALRFFLNSGLPGTVDLGSGPGVLSPIDGSVTVTSSGGTRSLPFRGARALATGTHDRNSSDSSLILEMPLALMAGSVTLDIRCSVRGHSPTDAGFGFTARRTVSMRRSRRESVLPILLVNAAGGIPAPQFTTYLTALAGARRMMPIAETGLTVNPPITWVCSLDLTQDFAWRVLLAQLATTFWIFPETPRDGVRTAVVDAPLGVWGGLGTSFPWGTFISRVDYITSGGASFGFETFAHEWFHAYGQLHANACTAGWPYDDRVGSTVDEPGFDFTAPSERVVPSTAAELMSYCGPVRWPSTSSYGTAVAALRG